MNFPPRYIPKSLTLKDRKKQKQMLLKSKRFYKIGKFFTRKKLNSFPQKRSKHIAKAQRIYGVEKITPNRKLAVATGCSVKARKKIVNKGEGAYYSSGSRPNQTPQSWGYARLASAITGGNASKVDYHILEEGCDHDGKAFQLAQK